MVFLVAAVIYIVAGAFYVCFASGEIQPWNSAEHKQEGKQNTFILLSTAITNVIFSETTKPTAVYRETDTR